MTDSASALALRSRWLAFLADVTSRRGVGSIRADRAFDSGRSRVRTRSIAKLLELLRDLRPTLPCPARDRPMVRGVREGPPNPWPQGLA